MTTTEVQQVPAHVRFEAPEGASAMLVSIPFSDALDCKLEERWDALDSHVKGERGDVSVIARQFHSYTRKDGYIYKIWFVRN